MKDEAAAVLFRVSALRRRTMLRGTTAVGLGPVEAEAQPDDHSSDGSDSSDGDESETLHLVLLVNGVG